LVICSCLLEVGRLSGKDNKIFKSPMKMGDWIEKKFKLKNKHLDEQKLKEVIRNIVIESLPNKFIPQFIW
jgi:hypothetical protein